MVTADLLSRWSFFAGLSATSLGLLAELAGRVSYRDGATIFEEGVPATTLYLLLDGWVDILSAGPDGRRSELLTTLTAGDIFGWSALVEPYVYTATAHCATPATALGFPGAALLVLFESDTGLCYTLMNRICRVIAGRLSAARSQMVSMYVTR
jgi:CRP/FNR family transcriptional regulator, cyclic AMP receptor protein